jgi:hypothetical protein
MVFSEPVEPSGKMDDNATVPIISLVIAFSMVFLTPVVYFFLKGVVVR